MVKVNVWSIRSVADLALVNAILENARVRPQAQFTAVSDIKPASDTLLAIAADGRRMGTQFTRMGILPGDLIGVMLPNWREWLVACVATQQAGAVMLPIVTFYGAKELGFILAQSQTKMVITPDHWRSVDYTKLVSSLGDLPHLQHHIRLGAEFDALSAMDEMRDPVTRSADDLAMLVYTSGTTADPKGVKHSNRSLLAELHSMAQARNGSDAEAILSPWPPGHIAGALSMLRFLVQGVTFVAIDTWDAAQAAALIEQHHITFSSGTPFHLTGLLDAADRDGCDLSSLRHYLVGAAPVPSTLVERCVARNLAVYHCYGSSEHPTVTSGTVDDPLDKRLHTEGRILAGNEMRFVDDDGNEVGNDEDGEICTRGPDLFTGYFDAALNAAAFLSGGWYRTGDIGRLDADGYLLITDRKKDIIIRGGENISSKEVEGVLLRHAAIADVAVVAAPDDRMGEVVRACVVAKPGSTITLEDIRTHFALQGIAKQKTPERLTLHDGLPRNASGKVLKHILRQT